MAQIREGLAQEKLGNPYGIADYSTFEYSSKHATTEPFGLLLPFDVKNGITGDVHKLSNNSIERSFTMDAPLMSQVWKNKEWFMVPKMAILPNAWDKIYKQPAIGDDVDAQEVGTSINAQDWNQILRNIHNLLVKTNAKIKAFVDDEEQTAKYLLDYLFKSIILNEYIFSYGSLLNRLGASMASIYINKYKYTFDEIFNQIISVFINGAFQLYWEDNEDEHYFVDFGMNRENTHANSLTMRECLQKMRDNLEFHIYKIFTNPEESTGIAVDSEELIDRVKLREYFAIIQEKMDELGIDVSQGLYEYSKPMQMERLWAYQFICAEYYTDDKIDYIYNDDIFREYISTLIKTFEEYIGEEPEDYYYTYNGIKVPYDWCSAHFMKMLLTFIINLEDLSRTDEDDVACRTLFTVIFNINRSLKYMDYFTGGRTRPLATNDVIVSTSGNQFRVIELSKRTQETRFKMAVNRIGNKVDEYVEGLLGIRQAVDYHYALWIGKTTDVIHATETENTSAQQYSLPYAVTSRFEGYSNQYGFEAKLDRDAILMGITYYDIERYYFRGVDRHFMHVNRFDMFNQFMQYTGDQPVYSEEYDARLTGPNETYFSYKPAYEEFKEGINKADSGFILSLKGFIFLDDVNEKNFFNKSSRAAQHLSPDFIRSKPTELDRFYSNLGNNYSLGTYFHFIVIYNNGDNAVRPMAYNPALNI